LGRVRIEERPVADHVRHMVAAEFVVECDIHDDVGIAAEFDVFAHQVTPSRPPVRFLVLRRSVAIPARWQMASRMVADGLHVLYTQTSLMSSFLHSCLEVDVRFQPKRAFRLAAAA